jgi:chromosome segregation ATPase
MTQDENVKLLKSLNECQHDLQNASETISAQSEALLHQQQVLSSLEKKISSLNEEYNTSLQTIDLLKSENIIYSKQISTAEEIADHDRQLAGRIEELEVECEALKTEVSLYQSKFSDIQQRNDSLENEAAERQSKHAVNVSSLTNKLDSLESIKAALERKIAEHLHEIQLYQNQQKDIVKLQQEAEHKAGALQVDLESRNSLLTRVEQQCADQAKLIAELQFELSKASQSLEVTLIERNELKSAHSIDSGKISLLEAEIVSLQNKIAKSDKAKDAAKPTTLFSEALEQERARNAALQSQVNALQNISDTQRRSYEELEAQNKALIQDVDNLRATTTALEEQLSNSQVLLQNLKADYDRLESAITSNSASAVAHAEQVAREKIEALQEEIQEKTGLVNVLLQEIAPLRQVKAREEDARAVISSLQLDLDRVSKELETAKQISLRRQAENDILQVEVGNATARLASLENEILEIETNNQARNQSHNLNDDSSLSRRDDLLHASTNKHDNDGMPKDRNSLELADLASIAKSKESVDLMSLNAASLRSNSTVSTVASIKQIDQTADLINTSHASSVSSARSIPVRLEFEKYKAKLSQYSQPLHPFKILENQNAHLAGDLERELARRRAEIDDAIETARRRAVSKSTNTSYSSMY